MTNIFYDNLFKELNKKQIFSFDDIQQIQENITDVVVKESVKNYFFWFKDNYKSYYKKYWSFIYFIFEFTKKQKYTNITFYF